MQFRTAQFHANFGPAAPRLAAAIAIGMLLAAEGFALYLWLFTGRMGEAAPPEPLHLDAAASIVAGAQPFGAAPGGTPMQASGSLRLLGTMASHGKLPGQALIAAEGRPGQSVWEGDVIEGVGELKRVGEDQVEIISKGQPVILRLPESRAAREKDAAP